MEERAAVSDNYDGPLGRLALSRETVDRVTEKRSDPAWLEEAWADPRARVLVVHEGRTLARESKPGGDGMELRFVSPAQAPEGLRFLLGVDDDGVPYFGVAGTDGTGTEIRSEYQDYRAVNLRSAGALLSDRDAGLFTHAVALANWHVSHTHCPRCGSPTVPDPAGHVTRCPEDGSEHFPRTDPAVIMLVTDPEDRCLLARNAMWPERRMSVLAGFVDPGESAEHAVAREVHEETSIDVGRVEYLGSQPWPMPRSLMLGYRAVAAGGQTIVVDEEEIAEARWFTRAELRAALDEGELSIAPTSSIARRLIEFWYGGELPDGPGSWASPVR